MRCLFAKGRQAKEGMVFYLTDQSGKVGRAAVMAQLSVIVGLAGDLSSVPSTRFGPLTASWNSSSGYWTLFWPPKATHLHVVYTHRNK